MRFLITLMTLAVTIAAQPINHALTGTATQSTLGQPAALASLAIDGNPDGQWGNGSVTHTQNVPGGWWKVALASVQAIDEIRLYNRSDCCGLRLSNFRLTVFLGMMPTFQQDFYLTTGSVPQGDAEIVPMPAATIGDRVRVELLGTNNNSDNVLSLAEVEVIQYGPLPEVNIAPLGTATQSSFGSGGLPERAIDGNRDGHWLNGSVSHTANNSAMGSWWQVALPSRGRVDFVRLWNRSDCCWTRLSNFRVSIWDGATIAYFQDAFTATGSVGSGLSWTMTPPTGTIGDRVRVELLGFNNTGNSVLSLAECQVFRTEAGLSANLTRVSAATGGVLTLVMDAGTSRAGFTHFLAGTASGASPGITLAGFSVPLNPDPWTDFMLLTPNAPPYANTLGALDLSGRAVATLTVPPGLSSLVGLSLHHVFGVIDGSGSLIAVSNAASITMDP